MRRLKAGYKIGAIPPNLFDAAEKFILAKRVELLFTVVTLIVATGVAVLMLFWLLHQIRVSFYL